MHDIEQKIKQAVQAQNLSSIRNIVDFLRFKQGFNYNQMQALFSSVAGIDAATFENLMEELDNED